MKSITSRSNPLVSMFRDLAAHPDPEGVRVLLDGVHLIREADAAGLAFECVAIADATLGAGGEAAALARRLHDNGHMVITVTAPVLRAISPVRTPSGIVAIALRSHSDSRVPLTPGPALFLVVADVQDPGNVGAIVRIAEAGGVSHVIVCGTTAHPYGWKALRGSMGSALRMPISRFATIGEALATLASSGARTVAAVPRDGLTPDDVQWTGRVALLIGGEGAGLDGAQIADCTERVTIPMRPPVESLNVSSAAAVLVYAANRQRTSSLHTPVIRPTLEP